MFILIDEHDRHLLAFSSRAILFALNITDIIRSKIVKDFRLASTRIQKFYWDDSSMIVCSGRLCSRGNKSILKVIENHKNIYSTLNLQPELDSTLINNIVYSFFLFDRYYIAYQQCYGDIQSHILLSSREQIENVEIYKFNNFLMFNINKTSCYYLQTNPFKGFSEIKFITTSESGCSKITYIDNNTALIFDGEFYAILVMWNFRDQQVEINNIDEEFEYYCNSVSKNTNGEVWITHSANKSFFT